MIEQVFVLLASPSLFFFKLQMTKAVFLPISLLQVQMKDFRFSYKFKMACKEDVLKLCPNIKKKYVVPDQTAI